jgi:hypothetical protein
MQNDALKQLASSDRQRSSQGLTPALQFSKMRPVQPSASPFDDPPVSRLYRHEMSKALNLVIFLGEIL